ncbi:YbhB/YbcL family Raf kinase inhibitor-like protein [Candidatus Azambacteria bacterium]|nr:YbhB/YbcL family Raf kinase inhibitor-like protein [Candidatus Azambacteria bacterium]MBI3685171.1 YbhB/YbcL family Raf kinase inhibitor-like protein [Candidatus Azambacteria bacterium]
MKIESPAFAHNEMIPAKYTCDGENINPQLSISGVPKEAKSLVLIVDDPDASKGLWVHWIAWNISSDTKEIPENSVPSGAREGMTDSGKPGWRGPCPSSGTHRYFFKLYALDAMLGVPIETDKIELEAAMINHILASTELIGFYQKQRK